LAEEEDIPSPAVADDLVGHTPGLSDFNQLLYLFRPDSQQLDLIPVAFLYRLDHVFRAQVGQNKFFFEEEESPPGL
jgi:hypothetical protein